MLFRFKQFVIKQEAAAMKVGTDGVLLGAWTPLYAPSRILDVGAGTGLLSLMLAQRTTNATIEAIEIDEAAYNECCENLQNSPWAERLKAYHTSFQEFLSVGKLYDLIISNPPFYTANYKAPAAARHIARSAEALPFDILLGGVSRLLASTGYFSVIIPYAEEESFIHFAAQYALYPVQGLRTQGTPDAPLKRSILLFSNTRTITPFVPQTLTIEMTRHNYTLAYKTLTKEFYLNF